MARSLTLFLSCCLLVCSQRIAAQTRMADSALNFFRVRSNINYTSARWQIAIDSALTFDSTVATLWQWKGMPYFKNADYASSMPCYDKAAHYDPNNYLSMRAFMKAVFAKDYEGGIKDFLKIAFIFFTAADPDFDSQEQRYHPVRIRILSSI